MNNRARAELNKAKKAYGLEAAMSEIDEAMEFARFTRNATALANLLQLKAKINSLIIDKVDHRMSGSFQINISGINSSRAVLPAPDVVQEIAGGQSGSNANDQLQSIGSDDKELS